MLLFNLLPIMGVAYAIIAALFVIAPIIVFWMVWRVLKDGRPSKLTFDDAWYEDVSR